MKKPLLIMFVGVPGSGKTTFAKQLAEKLNAAVLNSDAIRLSMWGSLEAIWKTHENKEARALNNQLTFGAMDYAAGQILASGTSVVYDCNANGRQERQKMANIAINNAATAIVVRIQTPKELAVERINTRRAADDSHQKNPEKAREIVERFAAEIEEPLPDENVVKISGELSFEEQFAIFQNFVEKLT